MEVHDTRRFVSLLNLVLTDSLGVELLHDFQDFMKRQQNNVTLSVSWRALALAVRDGRCDLVHAALDMLPVSAWEGVDGLVNGMVDRAVQHRFADVARVLVASGRIDVNYAAKEDEMTALMRGVQVNSPSCVAVVLGAKGVDVNLATPTNRDTALKLACARHDTRCLDVLLGAAGLDVNQGAPLVVAVQCGAVEAVKKLLGHRDIDVEGCGDDAQKWSPLFVACRNGELACARVLVEVGGAEMNSRTQSGCTPLMVACKRGALGCVRYLLSAGKRVDANAQARCGVTALYTAVFMEQEAVVAILLRTPGLRVNAVYGASHTTALHRACKSGNVRMTRMLLRHGACRFAVTSKTGQTPEHKGVGHAGVRALFARGVDYWTRLSHHEHGVALRAAVSTVCGAAALGRNPKLPHLPAEMWLLICTHLRSADFVF